MGITALEELIESLEESEDFAPRIEQDGRKDEWSLAYFRGEYRLADFS